MIRLRYLEVDYFGPNIMYFWYYYQFFILTLKIAQPEIVTIYFPTRNLYILSENTTKYCSWIIVVHIHGTVFFSKSHPACHNIVNSIKPGSDSRKTD